MHLSLLISGLLPLVAHALRIVQSNDDGWAEKNVRVLFDSLTAAGHDVVLSAPAENKSGSGSIDLPPTPRTSACQYDSCPANSPSVGHNSTNPRLNWVNSYPVTSMRYGISTFAPTFFGTSPVDIALSGPNVGSNLGLAVFFSGTVGAAVYAAHNANIPSIAFSGASGDPTAWDAATPISSRVYAHLAMKVTAQVISSGVPYLPTDVFLNVNFPEVSGASCSDASQFTFVLTRLWSGIFSPPDVETCGSTRLPTESDVVGTAGCYVSISVGDANDKTDADATKQAVVLQKLKPILSCLP